ncbi:MAG: Uma2 family endonuclease [Candidatus Tectomicrobia bacterium]|uniref:Uma2 family endonuclease n=1 Tax=Tectimicrobiota bacterium TaxID=2528274 RepID=A0A937W6S8_UNCTE|nr:Uma2 family endonuclease [Candidatus Tectomicrobia bacterium]
MLLPLQADLSHSPRELWPTMYDLPSEYPGDSGVPDEFHIHQSQLLRETFQPPAYMPDRFFSAIDLNLYYTLRHPLWYKRPDWFAALGVPRQHPDDGLRLSYVTWQESAAPYLVVELLSPGTEREDLGRTTQEDEDTPPTKWMVYEQILQIPYYVLFSRYTDEVRYFALTEGVYRELHPPAQRLWLPEAGLGLGRWFGTFEGLTRQWLRCYDADGAWILTPYERERLRAEQARQDATQERLRTAQAHQEAQQARQEAQRLAARLRAFGIDPAETADHS